MKLHTANVIIVVGVNPEKILDTIAALFALADQNVRIARIDLIGTKPAWHLYTTHLGGPAGILSNFLSSENPIPPAMWFHLIRDLDTLHPLEDLRTTNDFIAAWHQVFDIVRERIRESDLVLGAFRGARKALAQALTLAFQLLARPQDRLIQVVPTTSSGDRPKRSLASSNHASHLAISDMPFLRVRELPCTPNALGMANLVAAVQPRLEDRSQPSLEFHVNAHNDLEAVIVNGRTFWPNRLGIRLRRRDLTLWLHLARLRTLHTSTSNNTTTSPKANPPTSLNQPPGQTTHTEDSLTAPDRALPCSAVATSSVVTRRTPCPCCFREASDLCGLVPEGDRDFPDEYVRQAMSRIKRALIEFGLPMSHIDAVRFRGAGSRPNTAYGVHLDPEAILIRTAGT